MNTSQESPAAEDQSPLLTRLVEVFLRAEQQIRHVFQLVQLGCFYLRPLQLKHPPKRVQRSRQSQPQ